MIKSVFCVQPTRKSTFNRQHSYSKLLLNYTMTIPLIKYMRNSENQLFDVVILERTVPHTKAVSGVMNMMHLILGF